MCMYFFEENENFSEILILKEFKKVSYINNINVLSQEATEGNNAKDMFGGRLTPDFVAEKLGHSNFLDVREMDLPNSGIRIVDLGAGDVFTNLRR